MLKALDGYAKWKHAIKSSDPLLKIPLTWPLGTYGLIKTTHGCPSGEVDWGEGWRYHNTENNRNGNFWSDPLHVSGEFGDDIRIDFCIKGSPRITEFDMEWPSGDYCILKHLDCPAGFNLGWIKWDDEDDNKELNKYGGSLPDGHYDGNTLMHFCCRGDGSSSKEILLPTEAPFILLKHTGPRECQRVHGMDVREEYINWDNEDSSNADETGGDHPFEDGGDRNHRLHFCYYTKT